MCHQRKNRQRAVDKGMNRVHDGEESRKATSEGASLIMSNTDSNPTPKTRGRKKIEDGGKPSPKKIYCLCTALIKGNMVVDEVLCASSSKDTMDAEVKAEASKLFLAAHGENPSGVYGPYFHRAGASAAPAKKRDTVSGLSLENANLAPNRTGTAIYKGWNVSVKFVDNDPEAVYILYKNHATEEKKTKPANKFVRRSALENLEIKDRPTA